MNLIEEIQKSFIENLRKKKTVPPNLIIKLEYLMSTGKKINEKDLRNLIEEGVRNDDST